MRGWTYKLIPQLEADVFIRLFMYKVLFFPYIYSILLNSSALQGGTYLLYSTAPTD